MLDMDISKNLDFGTDLPPKAKSVVSIPFDDALISQHGAGMDIDSNEASPAGGAKRERRASIVAQDVEANGQPNRSANCAASGSHRGDCLWPNVVFCKRYVAEIFDEKSMGAAGFVSPSVADSSGDDFFQIAVPSRSAWKRKEMDDANQDLSMLVKKIGQRCWLG